MHGEEGKSNHILQVVKDNDLAVSLVLLGTIIGFLFLYEFWGPLSR